MSNLLFEFTNANIEEKVFEYYGYYLRLFTKSKNYINDKEIYLKRFPDIEGFDRPYFHMITMEYTNKKCSCPRILILCEKTFKYNPLLDESVLLKNEKPREICPNRMIALPSLEGFFNKKLLIWEEQESVKGKGLKTRIKCYSVEDEYLIILDKRNNGDIYFVTSFPIEYNWKKTKLMDKYNQYLKQQEHVDYVSKTIE